MLQLRHQGLLMLLQRPQVMDVGEGAQPFHGRPARVRPWSSTPPKPPVLRAFSILNAAFDVKEVLFKRLVPCRFHEFAVIRVNGREPPKFAADRVREPGVTGPLGARPGPSSAIVGAPDVLGYALDQDPQPFFALA